MKKLIIIILFITAVIIANLDYGCYFDCKSKGYSDGLCRNHCSTMRMDY